MVVELIFASVILVSLISFVGVFTLGMGQEKLRKWLLLLVSFSVGALFGDVFLHLLPEATEQYGFTPETGFFILCSIVVFFILEKLIRWHHHHQVEEEKEIHSMGYINLIADALHNFLDGVIIAGSYLVSIPLGITTTIAVIFHEIPQEIGDFGVLLHSGFTVKQALKFNFLSALAAVVGAGIGLAFTSQIQGASAFIVPFTAGSFIYLAGTDMLPEVQKERDAKTNLFQFIAILLGIGVMAALLALG